MSNAPAISSLRDALSRHVRDMAREGRFSSREIIRDFKEQNAAVIAPCADFLIDAALIQLSNGIRKRTTKSEATTNQTDLFQAFKLPPVLSLSSGSARGKKVKISTADLTLQQAEVWLHEHTKPEARKSRDVEAMEGLLKRVRPFMNGAMTLGEGWEASKQT